MLKNELRFGNLILGADKKVYKIDSPEDFYYVDVFEPIPLKKGWLRIFGFKKWGKYYIDSRNYTLYFKRNGKIAFAGTEVSCPHVHQLQNFFYAITSEELTIK